MDGQIVRWYGDGKVGQLPGTWLGRCRKGSQIGEHARASHLRRTMIDDPTASLARTSDSEKIMNIDAHITYESCA